MWRITTPQKWLINNNRSEISQRLEISFDTGYGFGIFLNLRIRLMFRLWLPSIQWRFSNAFSWNVHADNFWADYAPESLYCCTTCQRCLRSTITCGKAHLTIVTWSEPLKIRRHIIVAQQRATEEQCSRKFITFKSADERVDIRGAWILIFWLLIHIWKIFACPYPIFIR